MVKKEFIPTIIIFIIMFITGCIMQGYYPKTMFLNTPIGGIILVFSFIYLVLDLAILHKKSK